MTDAPGGGWPLLPEARERAAERIGANLAAMSFFDGKAERIGAAAAAEHAARIEQAAFTAGAAVVQQPEPGPAALRAYAKTAGLAMLEVLRGDAGVDDAAVGRAPSAAEGGQRLQPGQAASAAPSPAAAGRVFDLSGGKRETISTRAAAEELLSPLLVPGHAFERVCLSNKSFNLEAAAVVGAALANSRDSLVEADLSDIIAGQKEAEALAALTEICAGLEGSKLRLLSLSDNALGEKGLRACAAALRGQTSLQELHFCNNGISVEAAQAIKELLPSATNLSTLHFHNNMTGDGGAQALAPVIAQARQLRNFRFSSTRVGAPGAVALADALAAGTSLTELDLRDNMFSKEGGLAVARMIQSHQGLRELYLGDTGLLDEGIVALAGALQSTAADLEVLDLGGSEINRTGAAALAGCLKDKFLLRVLLLPETELENRAAKQICQALLDKHEALQELDLSGNALRDKGGIAAAEAVAGKAGFKLLNLNGNSISAKGIELIEEILSLGKTGTHVLGPVDDMEANEDEDDEDDEDEEDNETHEEAENEDSDEDGGDGQNGELIEQLDRLKV